jgi:predicted helicase
LHGNAKKKETAPDGSRDENVFDIQQGVSINIFVKTKNTAPHDCKISHADLCGKRIEKYSFLLENNLQTINWTELTPQAPQYFFVNKNFENKEEYEKGFLINDLFPVNSVGIVTANDAVFVNDRKEDLIRNVKENFDTANENLIQKINYRPFDTRFVYYDTKLIERPREKVMRYFQKEENLGLVICRQAATNSWQLINITKNIVDDSFVSNRTKERGYVFPLYLYQEHFGKTEKVANVNENIKNQISTTATPEHIFDYIYAVLHSPSYREKYKEFLKIDFPHVPYPQDAEQFNKLAAFGKKLRHLHLMENITIPNNFANFPKPGNNEVENAFTEKSNNYQDNKVWINNSQYFDNVPEIAWKFYIGGYQPAQKWLKDRKDRKLSYEDIEHYRKIIFILNETDTIMKEIDLIYC